MDAICIEHVTKSFDQTTVIDDLSFKVPEHAIFGFVGKNGAGKTTTMKMIVGLIKPTSGTIKVLNETVHFGETKTNRHIGYLPDVPEFYNYMNPLEYLKLCGQITGLSNNIINERSKQLLSIVGIDNFKKRIGGYSRGMKQRLGIAQALINEPKLLICDEPTSALDPIGRKEILDILLQVKGKTTVIFSTHILSDVERICDNIGILDKGKLVLCGNLSDIKEKARHDRLLIEFSSNSDKKNFIGVDEISPQLTKYEENGNEIILHTNNLKETQAKILSTLLSKNIMPLKLEVQEPNLEDLFMEVIK